MVEKSGIRVVEKNGIRNEVAILDSRHTNSGFFDLPTACVQATCFTKIKSSKIECSIEFDCTIFLCEFDSLPVLKQTIRLGSIHYAVCTKQSNFFVALLWKTVCQGLLG